MQFGMIRWSRAFTILLIALLIPLLGACTITQKKDDNHTDKGKVNIGKAETYLEQGLTDAALAAFGQALEENPNLIDAYIGMADIYEARAEQATTDEEKVKWYNQSRVRLEAAVERDTQHFEAHYKLGHVYQLLGRAKDAIRMYLQALTINPRSFEANNNVASAYLQLGLPADALPFAKRATELNRNDQSAWGHLAESYRVLGRHEDAVDAYREAVELGELETPLLLGMADSHLKLENFDRAENVLRSLVRRENSSTAHERLAYALFKQRRYQDALLQFNKAIEITRGQGVLTDPIQESKRKTDMTAALNGRGACLMTLYLQGGREDKEQRDAALNSWRESLMLRKDQPKIVDLLHRYRSI